MSVPGGGSSLRRPLRVWSLVALGLAGPLAARAQTAGAPEAAAVARPDRSAEARRQFMVGERLFRAGRYREAARAYQRGYRLSKRPGFLINIAHCHVRLGEPEQAREQYQRFLAEAPDAPHIPQVTRALADLDAQLGTKRHDARAPVSEGSGGRSSESQDPPDLASWRPGVSTIPMVETPPLPSSHRDRLHEPSPAEQALKLGPPPAPPVVRPRWLWPAVGVAAAVVVGSFAVFAARDQGSGTLSRGSIGTIRR